MFGRVVRVGSRGGFFFGLFRGEFCRIPRVASFHILEKLNLALEVHREANLIPSVSLRAFGGLRCALRSLCSLSAISPTSRAQDTGYISGTVTDRGRCNAGATYGQEHRRQASRVLRYQ